MAQWQAWIASSARNANVSAALWTLARLHPMQPLGPSLVAHAIIHHHEPRIANYHSTGTAATMPNTRCRGRRHDGLSTLARLAHQQRCI